MNDWVSTLGGNPGEVFIKVSEVGVGPLACSLPNAAPYNAPGVGCVDLEIVNQTGLDTSTMLLELFPLKQYPLQTYGPMLSAEVEPSAVIGDLVHDPENEPGPLWVVSEGQSTTVTMEVGSGMTLFGVRVLAQREICDNGMDDDNDGRIDEACRSLPDGASCNADIDCASAICSSGACMSADSSWVTVGVFEIDWGQAAQSGEVVLESLPTSQWGTDYVHAPPKAIGALLLELTNIGLSAAECDVSDLGVYGERGVHCATLQVAGVPQLGASPLVIEWLGTEGAPYERPFQSAFSFDTIPQAAEGLVPNANASFPIGSLLTPRADGRNLSMEVRPLLAASARSLVRVVTPVGVVQGPPVASLPNSPPGVDTTFPSQCLAGIRDLRGILDGSYIVRENNYDDPAVYGVLGEFDQILEEIGWTAEYLTSQFVTQSYNEDSPFQYMIESFGEDRIREVFKIPNSFDLEELGVRPGKYVTYFASEKSFPYWVELLRPDHTGRRDSYWGLRALGEHGALATRSIRMRQVGGVRITRTDADNLLTLPNCEMDRANVRCAEPIYETVAGKVEVPQPRQYVLPQANYVVRTMQTGTIATPYHGPMPGYCEPAEFPSPELRPHSPLYNNEREYSLTNVTPPPMRWGMPGLTWYGWENVELDACGSTIRFEVNPFETRRLVPSAERPSVESLADGWLPMCLRSHGAGRSSREHALRMSHALLPNNLTIMGSTDVSIRNLQLRGAIDSLDMDMPRVPRSPAREPNSWWDGTAGARRWNNFSGTPDPSSRIPPNNISSNCASEAVVDVLRPDPFILAGAVPTPHTLVTSDNVRLRLDGVHTSHGQDPAIIGENENSPRCPGPDNTIQSETSRVGWTPDDNGVRDTRSSYQGADSPNSPSMYHVPSIDIHTFRPENNVGRFPTERMSTPGLCDAFNCMETELLVRNSSFEFAGRNALTVGNVRQAVFDHMRVVGGGAVDAHPLFLGAPRAGVDFEGGDQRSNPLVTIALEGGGTTAAPIKSGQYNILNSLFEDNIGSAVTLYNNWGRYEEVRFISSNFLSPRDVGNAKALINAPNTGVDFVECRFDSLAERSFEVWAKGGSGIFHDNLVLSVSDVVFGGNAASCSTPLSLLAVEFAESPPPVCTMPEFPPLPVALGEVRREGRPARCTSSSAGSAWRACDPADWTGDADVQSECCAGRDDCRAIACEDSCCIVEQTETQRAADEQAWHIAFEELWNRQRGITARAETAALVRNNAATLQATCDEEYDGASPYPRCVDAVYCQADRRSALVDVGDGPAIPITESTLVRPGTDIPWTDEFQQEAVRSVSGNTIIVTPTLWEDEWEGTLVDLNAELVDNNSVCIENSIDSPETPTVSIGAPFMPRFLNGNEFDGGLMLGRDCATPLVTRPSLADAEWDADITSPDDPLAQAWAVCECGMSSHCSRFGGIAGLETPAAGCNYALDSSGNVTGSLRCGDDRGLALSPDYTFLGVPGSTDASLCWTDTEAIAYRQRAGAAPTEHPVGDVISARVEAIEDVREAFDHWYFPPDRYSTTSSTPPSDLSIALSAPSAIPLDSYPDEVLGPLELLATPDCPECDNPGDPNCYEWPEGIARQ